MGVRIDIGLDFEGNHTFAYEPCDGPRALDVPESVLRRWAAERAAFARARARWQAVVAEVDEYLVHNGGAQGDTFAAESNAFDSSPLDATSGHAKSGRAALGHAGKDALQPGAKGGGQVAN